MKLKPWQLWAAAAVFEALAAAATLAGYHARARIDSARNWDEALKGLDPKESATDGVPDNS